MTLHSLIFIWTSESDRIFTETLGISFPSTIKRHVKTSSDPLQSNLTDNPNSLNTLRVEEVVLPHRYGGYLLIHRYPGVIKWRRLEDDPEGSHEASDGEEPEEEAIQDHGHELPVFHHLRTRDDLINVGILSCEKYLVGCCTSVHCLVDENITSIQGGKKMFNNV